MPHVSNQKLDDEERKALYRELVRSLEKAFSAGKGGSVLHGFFTYTEREMFAKRFAVIAMLEREVSVSKISRSLKMSPATIDVMQAKYEAGRYVEIVNVLKGRSLDQILDKISDNLNTAGGVLPPYVGRGKKKIRN
jgi:Trp operon repressor